MDLIVCTSFKNKLD